MTCIAGIAKDGAVWIGGDNGGFIGSTILSHMNGKVFRLGEAALGVAGNRRFAEIVRYSFSLPDVNDSDIERYMATTFIDALRETLKGKGYLHTKDGRETSDRESGDGMLVGIRGMLFFVGCDFTASAVSDGVFAVGCGMDFALGALHTTEDYDPTTRLRLALAAAEKYSDGVVGPFHVVSTQDELSPIFGAMGGTIVRGPVKAGNVFAPKD